MIPRRIFLWLVPLLACCALAGSRFDRRPPADVILRVSYDSAAPIDRSLSNITGTTVGGATFSHSVMTVDGDGDGSGHGSTVLIPESVAAPFTISVWVYPTAVDTSGFSAICGLRTSSSATFQFWLNNAVGYADISWGTETWGEMKTSLSTYLNRWNHIVLSYDGTGKQTASAWKLYQDGVSKTVSSSSAFGAYNVDNGIGKFRTADNVGDFHGKIDSFTLFNRALSEAEIIALYAEELQEYRP